MLFTKIERNPKKLYQKGCILIVMGMVKQINKIYRIKYYLRINYSIEVIYSWDFLYKISMTKKNNFFIIIVGDQISTILLLVNLVKKQIRIIYMIRL